MISVYAIIIYAILKIVNCFFRKMENFIFFLLYVML